jgi:DNA invertase Pin-like site-specific DNA recombinase
VITKDDLKAARRAYDAAIEEAEQARAAIVARAIAEGMPQKDVIDAMEYSRETVRRITQAGKEAQAGT